MIEEKDSSKKPVHFRTPHWRVAIMIVTIATVLGGVSVYLGGYRVGIRGTLLALAGGILAVYVVYAAAGWWESRP